MKSLSTPAGNFTCAGPGAGWRWTGLMCRDQPRRYTYDPAGNLASRTNGALVQTFAVDSANQLTNVTRATAALNFAGSGAFPPETYGSVTLASVTVNNQAAAVYADQTFATPQAMALVDGNNPFTVVAQDTAGHRLTNRYQAFLLPAQRLTYDLNGNLTGDSQRMLEYDDANRLTRVTEGNLRTEYAYDGFGRRHLRRELQQVNGAWLAGNTCYYVYAGWNVIREEHTWGNVDYTHGLELLSRRSDVPGEPALYYETDANGNIVLLVNESGQVAGRYEYDPYGNLVQMSGRMADVNRYRYSGKEYDPRTRLYYYGYRFYDPLWQRWTSRDPIEEWGGINLYQYVGNDPINYIDPNGLYVQFTTTSGMTYVIGEGYDDLTGNLQHIINRGEQVTELKISGHGSDTHISLDRYENNILTASSSAILTGDNQDITDLLNQALAKDATVYLNGCHTGQGKDNLAKQMSLLLPGRIITGQRGVSIGLTGNLGYTIRGERYEIMDLGGIETLSGGRVIGRKSYYQNGNLIGKGWLWKGF